MDTSIIYEEMRARDLTTSRRAWSEHWLGRSHNFASIHWSHPLPPDALLHLRARLLAEGHHDLAAKLLLVLLGEYPSRTAKGRKREVGA